MLHTPRALKLWAGWLGPGTSQKESLLHDHKEDSSLPDCCQGAFRLPFHASHWHSVFQPRSSVIGISCCPKGKKGGGQERHKNHLRNQRKGTSFMNPGLICDAGKHSHLEKALKFGVFWPDHQHVAHFP